MAVFSVPSPLLPSLTPASCLFVFLSSCLLLSLYPSAPGSVVSYLPPHIFRARRRDGLLGRRREAMPEEHAAERSWADGSFCRVARPLSASSFFSRRAHAFSLTPPVSGLFVRPSFVISSFAALGQDWHWPEWVARSVLCRLSFELGDAQRFGALPFHLYLVSPAARPSRGFKLRRTGRRRRLGRGWGGDAVEWNGWRNAPGRGPRRFARDALAAKSARRPILSSGFFLRGGGMGRAARALGMGEGMPGLDACGAAPQRVRLGNRLRKIVGGNRAFANSPRRHRGWRAAVADRFFFWKS